MADHGNEDVLARFNTLMREVSRGKTERTCFRPWEIELLIDMQSCYLTDSKRGDVLRRYEIAASDELARGAGKPRLLQSSWTSEDAAIAAVHWTVPSSGGGSSPPRGSTRRLHTRRGVGVTRCVAGSMDNHTASIFNTLHGSRVVARGTVKRILGSGYGWKPLTAFLLGGFPATIHEPNDEADQRDEGHDVYGRSVSSSGNSIVLMTALYALCSPNVPLVENRFCVRGRSGAALCAWQFWPSSLGRSRHCHGRQRYTQPIIAFQLYV